jgi:peptide/nickel transport system ATP-binding protein
MTDVTSDTPLLRVVNLVTHFDTPAGTVRAVDGVSFDLARGETIGIVGESGSGKSVLARSIMRLLPARGVVTGGTVEFRGEDITSIDEAKLRALWGPSMAMVFQDPMTSLNPVMRIGVQLTEGIRTHLGLSKADANEAALALMRSVGIPEPHRRLRQYPHQLSGGMRQRIVIAIALACGPNLLLADEPTTALDVTVQAQIMELLAAQRDDRDMAMVLITHDLGLVAGRTDRVAVMYAGRVVETGPTPRLFSHTRMPYTEALLRSIPRLDQPSHTRLEAITGRPPAGGAATVGCSFAPRCPYAQSKCTEETPPLVSDPDEPAHQYACWFPIDSLKVAASAAEVN